MNRPRLDVQVCLLSRVTRQYGPHPTSDLLGVDYTYTVPGYLEFPRRIPMTDLFVRFAVAEIGPTPIQIRVYRIDDDGSVMNRSSNFRFVVPFSPTDRVREHVFRLPNIRLPGTGLYAVKVGRVVRHRWRGLRWRTMATDYFLVER
jgi:hypothetical protein